MVNPTAASCATAVQNDARTGSPAALRQAWRYGVLQALDFYNSARQHLGLGAAIAVFDHEPPLTGNSGVDAAFAALAELLAHRDGWPVPHWTRSAQRHANPAWFVSGLPPLFKAAKEESPPEFASRNVFILDTALNRA